MLDELPLNRITGEIVDAAYKLHTALGPGLLESVYEAVLARDLERRGLKAARQVPLSFEYEGLRFSEALRIDILVESRVIVEIKSVERLAPVHPKQFVDVSAPSETSRRLAYQLRRCPLERRPQADRERCPQRRRRPPSELIGLKNYKHSLSLCSLCPLRDILDRAGGGC
ncbi:MAG TPA: GxxExxY protein [Rhizomicrobium sp.]|nr:GxxExxY protein [Rhizomicrobium sp.]